MLSVSGLIADCFLFRRFSYDESNECSDKIQEGKSDESSEKVSSLSDEDKGDQYVKDEYDVVKKVTGSKRHFFIIKNIL